MQEETLKLPKKLQEILERVKNTPMQEEKIAKKQEEIEEDLKEKLSIALTDEQREMFRREATLDILDAVIEEEELEKLDNDEVGIQDYYNLAQEIYKKVFLLTEKDENGEYVYKEIESQDKMKLLTYLKAKNVRKIDSKLNNLMNKNGQLIREVNELNEEETKKTKKQIKKILEEVKENNDKAEKIVVERKQMCLEYSGLETEEMTEWEKELVVAKVVAMANGNYTPKLGKN